MFSSHCYIHRWLDALLLVVLINWLYLRLVESSKERRIRLEEARKYFQFVQDHEDEEGWLVEKQRICKAGITAKDLRAVLSLQQKHKVTKYQ